MAVSSTESSFWSRSSSSRARRYGSVAGYSLSRIRHSPSTSTRTVLSGNLSILSTRAAQPTSCISSGRGFSASALRCSARPSRRFPPTTSSMSLMLCAVSTSSGATMPGKTTMSDRPRIGRISGSTREETRSGVSALPAVPRILINSVSGEVMIKPTRGLDAGARGELQIGSQSPSATSTRERFTGRCAKGTSIRKKPFRYAALAWLKS